MGLQPKGQVEIVLNIKFQSISQLNPYSAGMDLSDVYLHTVRVRYF